MPCCVMTCERIAKDRPVMRSPARASQARAPGSDATGLGNRASSGPAGRRIRRGSRVRVARAAVCDRRGAALQPASSQCHSGSVAIEATRPKPTIAAASSASSPASDSRAPAVIIGGIALS